MLEEADFTLTIEDEIDWIELTVDDVKPAAFTRLLEDNARATDFVSLWCYRPVWLKLLKLLNVQQPLPETVVWPRQGRKDAA